MDPDPDSDPDEYPDEYPDPAIFLSDLQNANKNQFVCLKVYCLLIFEGAFTSF
jgi:hypothetical protein